MREQDSQDPTGVGSPTADRGAPIIRARDRKANAALQMKLAGATWEEIAEVIGYPTPRSALVATERALEKELKTTESQARMRHLAGRRLESLLRSVWAKALDPDNPEHLIAVTKAREVIDRHARLYGLDAPSEVVVHSPTRVELERWVAQVASVTVPVLPEADIFDADIIDEEGDDDAVASG